jgi:hypothetical protein
MSSIHQPQPWEHQPGESPRAFAAFCAYRNLGPLRSLRAAAEAFYGRLSASVVRQMQTWSGTFNWVERSDAWDLHLDAEARQAKVKAQREMAERHAQEARGLQAKALERLRSLRPEELAPADVLRYLVEAAKLERLALGEPETVTEQRNGPVVLQIVEEIIGRSVATDSPNRTEEKATHVTHHDDTTSAPNRPPAPSATNVSSE